MRRTFTLVLALLLCVNLIYSQNQRIVCDETCKIEAGFDTSSSKSGGNYAVVSPVGRSSVKMIQQAPRLETLEGKTIAIVGESFMTHVTHPELKRLILKNYPTAKVILLDEIGEAGPFPAPGVTRQRKEEFEAKLKSMHVDAVIAGNGGCGLCTPKETGSCLTAEYIGIPSVIIAGPGFADQAYYTAYNNGVPVMRVALYPGAFATHTNEELIRNTREVLWPQIVEALTKPITQEELDRSASRDHGDLRDDVFYGTLDEVNAYFKENNWSDGLPFIPPTFEKVNEYLKYTDYAWDEVIATLPPAHRSTTTWHVAVNAVMSGCKPEYMPILIALTKAMGDGNFRRTLASTHAWIPFCWLNGPVARQLGIDSGQGQINEEGNVAIGRFMNLAMMNLAGYYVKQDRMGTFGYPISWCMVEDDAACQRVGWNPYHVQQGFNMNDNTVTASSTLLWGNNMAPSTTNPEKVMLLLAWDITERCQFALGSGRQFTNRTILMTEPVAATLAKKYKSTDALDKTLVSVARRPAKERAFANYYANPGSEKDGGEHTLREYSAHIKKAEHAAMTDTPPWYDSDAQQISTIPTMQSGATAYLITGDAARNKVQTMPGGGSATVKIELPRNWDQLMEELGYEALKEFYIR